jgi:protein-tyrosine-phosphatase
VAENFGCDLKNHVSRHITPDIASSVDLIVCMETWHVAFLRDLFPKMENKMVLLSRFEKNRASSMLSYSNDNILDPYGKTIPHYQECFQRIDRCIQGLLLDFQRISCHGR